jgi:outer membrane protein assembly factor BamB
MTRFKKIATYLIIVLAIAVIVLSLTLKQDIPNYIELTSVQWSYDTAQQIIYPPVIYKKMIFVQTESLLIALDAVTGIKVWDSPISSRDAPPKNIRPVSIVINGEILALQSQEKFVAVYNINDGRFLWDTYTALDISPVGYSNTEVYGLDITENLVLVARHNNNLAAYDVKTGGLVWESELPTRTGFDIMPDEDKILVGAADQLLTFDMLDGHLIKDYELDSSSGAMYKDQETIYVIYMNGACSISALNTNSLTPKWCIKPSQLDYLNGYTYMAVDENFIYFAGDNLLAAISKETGQVLWESPLSFEAKKISMYGSSIYVSGIDVFSILDKNNGEIQKMFKSPSKCSCLLGILDVNQELSAKPAVIYQIEDNTIKSYLLR